MTSFRDYMQGSQFWTSVFRPGSRLVTVTPTSGTTSTATATACAGKETKREWHDD